MKNPIQAILFDFGNVLVHWDVYRIFDRFFPDRAAVDSFLAEIDYAQWNARLDAGLPFAQGVAELSQAFPHHAPAIHGYHTFWRDGVSGPIPGSVEILRRLKQAGYPLYVLSNFSAEKFPLMRQDFAFVSLFDDVILSGEHRLIKPDPAFFRAALRRIGRAAIECLLIDDSLPNVEAARQLGLAAIRFQSPAQLERELKTLQLL